MPVYSIRAADGSEIKIEVTIKIIETEPCRKCRDPVNRDKPIDRFVNSVGGTGVLARRLGVGSTAVSNWRKRGRFPAGTYFRIRALASERGLDMPEELFQGHIEGSVG